MPQGHETHRLAYGYWGWALLTLAGAVAKSVLAYRVYRATMR